MGRPGTAGTSGAWPNAPRTCCSWPARWWADQRRASLSLYVWRSPSNLTTRFRIDSPRRRHRRFALALLDRPGAVVHDPRRGRGEPRPADGRRRARHPFEPAVRGERVAAIPDGRTAPQPRPRHARLPRIAHRDRCGGPVHEPGLGVGDRPFLVLLPNLLARPRHDRRRARGCDWHHEPGSQVHRPARLEGRPRARVCGLADRGRARAGHGHRRTVSVVLRADLRLHRVGRLRGRVSRGEHLARPPDGPAGCISGGGRSEAKAVIRQRLLAGPDLSRGPEGLAWHVQRLGPPPVIGPALIDVVESSGLAGRGGAAFPVGTKWRSIPRRHAGQPVVVGNGAEGEPQSLKDRVLMTARPHLVLDGAPLAARARRASRIAVVIGESHRDALASMSAALAERPEPELRQARIVIAPPRYVAGESSATVHLVGSGIARPTTRPPSMHEAGVDGRPTLVQNVESLAHVALIARYGAGWFGAGTVLITVVGAASAPGVLEVEPGKIG